MRIEHFNCRLRVKRNYSKLQLGYIIENDLKINLQEENMQLDYVKLNELAEEKSAEFKNADSYPHIVIDNLFREDIVLSAFNSAPKPDETFYRYNNPLEKKFAKDKVYELPESMQKILYELNSARFLLFLEKLTGINGLVSDPYYRGGGVHYMGRGCKLDVHIDFNKHPKLKLDRRLNLIFFIVKDWKESWNGDFQVWNGKSAKGEHQLTNMVERVYPKFNRMVIFATSEKSFHGVPEIIDCPEGMFRISLATYYYTNGRDDVEETWNPHSTTYLKKPDDQDDLDELRKVRNQGRIDTNTKGLID